MNHKRPPIPMIIILILVILVGGYFGIRSFLNKGTSALTASGTIEAIEVTISPEIGGKVADVLVDEGAKVKAGDVLFHLDDALLQAQRVVAVSSLALADASAITADASLATAQANYILAFDAARLESAGSRTSDWRTVNPAGYTLPGGYFNAADEIASAQTEVDAARSARDSDQEHLNTLLADPANASFKAAETRLEDVRATYLVAQDVLAHALNANNSDLRDAAQSARDSVRTALDDAQTSYDALKDTDAAKNIILARVDLTVAQERFEAAQDHLLALETGLNSPKLSAA
jgi:multidrug resistance efflux pump